jgi:hypothetical protein
MKVYRIEDASGNGPFRDIDKRMLSDDYCTYVGIIRNSLRDGESHPLPPAKMIADGHVIGCTSLEQLAFWVDDGDAIDILKRYNFAIKVFKVKSVARTEGNPQVGFHRKHARLTKILPLETLLTAI